MFKLRPKGNLFALHVLAGALAGLAACAPEPEVARPTSRSGAAHHEATEQSGNSQARTGPTQSAIPTSAAHDPIPACPAPNDQGVLQGIDVSAFQGDIDWQKVGKAGVRFAYVKKSEGITIHDPKFTLNWRGAKSAGVRTGAYHILVPWDDVDAQVASFMRDLSLARDDLPPALDLELSYMKKSARRGLTPKQINHSIQAWIAAIKKRTERIPVVYAGHAVAQEHFHGEYPFGDSPIWIAEYPKAEPGFRGVGHPASVSQAWSGWQIWQYGQGQVNGLPPAARVDRDRFRGSAADLERFIACTRTHGG